MLIKNISIVVKNAKSRHMRISWLPWFPCFRDFIMSLIMWHHITRQSGNDVEHFENTTLFDTES